MPVRKFNFNKVTSGLIATFLLVVLFSFGDASAFTTNQAATMVLGQPDFTTNTRDTTATTSSGLHSVAFDSSGNLWVTDYGNNRILMYPKASLGTSGSAATVVLGQSSFTTDIYGTTASTLNSPTGLAFDSTGNLWVVDNGNSRILMYPKASLGTSGSAATVVLGQSSFTTADYDIISANTLHTPYGLAFDSAGNLWVADGNTRILMYPKASLGTSGSAATVVLGQSSFTTDTPGFTASTFIGTATLAFDSTGNLWITDNQRILMFTKASLGTSGSAATVVLGLPDLTAINGPPIIPPTASSFFYPYGLAFDSTGNLWVADHANNRVLMYSQSSLGTSGSSATMVLGQPDFTTNTPSTTASLFNDPEDLAFDSAGNLWVAEYGNSRVMKFIGESSPTQAASSPISESSIPSWIHKNAKWWSEGSIEDGDFVKGIQYLVQQGIIKVPQTQQGNTQSQQIPSWIKKNAGWWSDGSIGDDEFIKGIQYLISSGIMKI